MRPLTKLQQIIFMVGGLLVVVGAAAYMLAPLPAFIVFSVGAVAFASMQMLQTYDGKNFIVRRLRRQQLLGALALLLAACCMCMQTFRFGFALRNEWVVCATIGCVLELYTSFRIPAELNKEK
ncbi:MAG: hypothetical protein IJQ44_02430 [Bacteroidaceae bacterium]|nr:hypothetical protein [Bacteroidaceae bacterium]